MLGVTLKIIPFHPPKTCSTRPCFSKPPPNSLWTFPQMGASTDFSGLPVPVFHHSQGKGFFAIIYSKPILCQFRAISPCRATTCFCKKSLSGSLVGRHESANWDKYQQKRKDHTGDKLPSSIPYCNLAGTNMLPISNLHLLSGMMVAMCKSLVFPR